MRVLVLRSCLWCYCCCLFACFDDRECHSGIAPIQRRLSRDLSASFFSSQFFLCLNCAPSWHYKLPISSSLYSLWKRSLSQPFLFLSFSLIFLSLSLFVSPSPSPSSSLSPFCAYAYVYVCFACVCVCVVTTIVPQMRWRVQVLRTSHLLPQSISNLQLMFTISVRDRAVLRISVIV